MEQTLMGSGVVVASNFLTLYTDKWFVVAIVAAFFIGRLAHVILAGYFPHCRKLTQALFVWTAVILGGYVACNILLAPHPDKYRFAWITGLNAIILYYGALWASTSWFKLPRVAQWLTLRAATTDEKGEIQFGETVQFLTKHPPKK